jgi:FAD-dependent sensor of blue light
MVDTTAAPETVFRLVYRSHMRIAPDVRKSELGEIFSVARSNNKRLGVTGALLVWDEFFVQTLEGDEAVVRDLYDRIHRDARHERVAIISEDPAAPRVFGRWSMARVGDEDEPDIPLLMNRDKGGISPAAPRPTTPDQEAVLDGMREAARSGAQPA